MITLSKSGPAVPTTDIQGSSVSWHDPHFRKDIQGLRALAIMLVVFSHAGLPGFAGGFIGVDIFFVLSGFLITGLLTREARTTGGIDFVRFYARRFRRLLPALLTVTVLSVLSGYFLLSPYEQFNQSQAATAVPLWASNFYFSFANVNYFSPEAASNLFLHTWSLAVEEQFYLLWPVLLYVLLLYRDGAGLVRALKPSTVYIGFALVFVISFILCIYWSYTTPKYAFYLMPARGWQFALGGMVYFLAPVLAENSRHYPLDQLYRSCAAAGLVLAGIALVFLDDTAVYPGVNALLPSFATALLLLSGTAPGPNGLTRLLSTRGLQHIGNLSYSWYLWHWPVLVLAAVLFPGDSLKMQALLILVSLILAQITYSCIETPVRYMRSLQHRSMFTAAFSLVMMGVVFGGLKIWQSQALMDARSETQLPYLEVRNNLPVLYSSGCDDWYASTRVLACSFGDDNAEHTAILIGDSIGVQWFSGLAVPLVNAGWRFIVYTKSACPIVDIPVYYPRIGMMYEVCEQWRAKVLSSIGELEPSLIFIGSAEDYNYSSEQWQRGTGLVLDQLAPLAQQLFIIPGTSSLPVNGPDCLARQAWQGELLGAVTTCTFPADTETTDKVKTALTLAMAPYSNVKLLDLDYLVCPENRCSARQNKQIVYRDNQHLNDQFVISHADEIAAQIKRLYPF